MFWPFVLDGQERTVTPRIRHFALYSVETEFSPVMSMHFLHAHGDLVLRVPPLCWVCPPRVFSVSPSEPSFEKTATECLLSMR